MGKIQPKLLNDPQKFLLTNGPPVQTGPVFEAGPGWGARLKKWFGTNYKPLFTLVVVGIILATAIALAYKQNLPAKPNDTVASIIIQVNTGDSKTLLARKALAEYLTKFTDTSLSNGQKVFIEETLRKKIDGNLFGTSQVEFKTDDIKTTIKQSQQLSPYSLQKWEEYAKNVRF